MATHITFFDTTPAEQKSFEKYFAASQYKINFFHEPLGQVPVYEFKDSDVISVYVTSHVDAKTLTHMPRLKLIACRSTGVDNIDMSAAKKHKIATANVPGYGQSTVAEYTFMLMLALVRKLPQVTNAFLNGVINYPHLTGFTLNGKTLGVVGTGKIGLAVITIAKSFGMEVLAYDPFPNKEAAQQLGYSYVGLPELLKQSDVVSLHAPMTKENFHLVDAAAFSSMKPSSLLINTARGELVDTKALINALQDRQIAGAGLDVLEGEPILEKDHEIELFRSGKKQITEFVTEHDILTKMQNVILSPHNAFNTREALRFIRKTTAQNIISFLEAQPTNIVSL